jgi:hypothetical protein
MPVHPRLRQSGAAWHPGGQWNRKAAEIDLQRCLSMSGSQNRKNSQRAYVFRFAPGSGPRIDALIEYVR